MKRLLTISDNLIIMNILDQEMRNDSFQTKLHKTKKTLKIFENSIKLFQQISIILTTVFTTVQSKDSLGNIYVTIIFLCQFDNKYS